MLFELTLCYRSYFLRYKRMYCWRNLTWGLHLLLGLSHSKTGAAKEINDVQQPLVPPEALATDRKQPNIIFILTDDQDLHMSSLDYMPHLQSHLVEEGTTFSNHYCTVALCCPSRVSLWTGKHAHNTNVTDINPPHGRYCPCVDSCCA